MSNFKQAADRIHGFVGLPADIATERIAQFPARELIGFIRDRVPTHFLALPPFRERMGAVLDQGDHGLSGVPLARALLIAERIEEALGVLDASSETPAVAGDGKVVRGHCFDTKKEINTALLHYESAADYDENGEGAAYYAAALLGPVNTNYLRWLHRNMVGFKARGAQRSIATQATSNTEDSHIPVQPVGKAPILSTSASLLLDVPLGTPSSSFLELNQNRCLPSVNNLC